jgi:hypothetical protein
MKIIEAIREIYRENLYSFYLSLGGKSEFATGSVSSARYLSNASMEWPSYILGGGKRVKSSLLVIFKCNPNQNDPQAH